jgi:hypothetical protein
MRLTASMIVRDEARCLARCLRSITPLVDEIVVVDTGSVDDTVAIARSFGARVAHRPWDDDFAAARNRALDLATGDWVLYVDADEFLEHGDRTALDVALAEHPDAIALRLLLRSVEGHTPFREYRLWSNRPDIRFRGRIHETVVPDLDRLVAAGVGTVASVDLRFGHDGYDGDPAVKHARNLPLLRAEIEADPARVYLWFHLGSILLDLGDRPGAREAWTTGARWAEAKAERGGPGAISVCHQRLVEDAVANGESAAEVIEAADRWFPDDAGIDLAAMQAAIVAGDAAEVERRATRLLTVDRRDLADRGIGIDERALGPWPLEARARARLATGDLEGARADLAAGEDVTGGGLEFRVLRHAAERRDPRDGPRRRRAPSDTE